MATTRRKNIYEQIDSPKYTSEALQTSRDLEGERIYLERERKRGEKSQNYEMRLKEGKKIGRDRREGRTYIRVSAKEKRRGINKVVEKGGLGEGEGKHLQG